MGRHEGLTSNFIGYSRNIFAKFRFIAFYYNT